MVVALSGYKDIAVISKGAYGTVYQAKNKLTGERVALKTLFLRHYPVQLNAEKKLVPGPGITQTALREISILRALSKKITKEPLIKLKKVLFSSLRIEKLEGQRVFLEFEFCDHDLGKLVDSVQYPFTVSHIKGIFLQLMKAVSFLHSHHILHRDIKLSNILYTAKGEIKLCDFGFARYHSEAYLELLQPYQRAYTPLVGTLWYRAPEILFSCKSYGFPIDVWALGCVIAELVLRTPLLPGKTEKEQVQYIIDTVGAPNPDVWLKGTGSLLDASLFNIVVGGYEDKSCLYKCFKHYEVDFSNVLAACLDIYPFRRITVKELEKHAFFLSEYPPPATFLPTFPSSFH